MALMSCGVYGRHHGNGLATVLHQAITWIYKDRYQLDIFLRSVIALDGKKNSMQV